ncbi:hypothetical protein DITRI_Ditri15bG0113700 [Diplodiscus trichospermus]
MTAKHSYMDNKNIEMVDVSCFLLVEASGDSELDCGPINKQCDQSMDIASAATAAAADEDDAESCSCDTITDRLDDFYEVILQLDEDQDFIDCNDHHDIGWSSSCNMWSLDEALGYISAEEAAEDGEEPRFGVNLCREVMDGMEDRVFWETCMAVGYP